MATDVSEARRPTTPNEAPSASRPSARGTRSRGCLCAWRGSRLAARTLLPREANRGSQAQTCWWVVGTQKQKGLRNRTAPWEVSTAPSSSGSLSSRCVSSCSLSGATKTGKAHSTVCGKASTAVDSTLWNRALFVWCCRRGMHAAASRVSLALCMRRQDESDASGTCSSA